MSRFITALLASTLIAAPALAQTAPAAAPAIKPTQFTTRTLANGLRVYAIRDTATPNVAVQVWYDVGGRDDPRGRSGFAHLFEHLMFKATRNLVPEQMDRLTEDVGGYNNASTSDDYTNYYEVVPANHLQRLLFAEGERLASLVVEPVSFASERDVVKEEYRQGLARPYGKLFQTYLPAISYTRHPYARGVIGDVANLDAATIDDVRAFHATYYRPDNAVLVVAGDFDLAQLDRWIDQYFAPIAKPAGAIPRVTVAEPPRTAAVSRTVYEPNTPLPAVVISWQLPPDRDADIPALTVLDAVLSRGESSRLYQSLVYREQLAQTAETSFDTRASTGMLAAIAIMAGGKTADAGEAALRREVARLRDAPVTPAELAEAKNEILTQAIRRRETAEGKALILAYDVLTNDDPHADEKQLAAIEAVTAADVQRVAAKYLTDAQSTALRYLPAEAKPATVAAESVAIAPTVETAALVAPRTVRVVTPATAAQRVAPPAPAAATQASLPTVVEQRLANGMRLVTVERHDLPLVTAQAVAIGGALTDPATRAGTAAMTATLMTKGTRTKSAEEIARAIESLGASIDAAGERDGAGVAMTVKADRLDPAMTILADVVRAPAFASEEVERARTQAVDELAVTLTNPGQVASLAATRAVFGAAPYGAPLGGSPVSLKAITRADIQRSHAGTWRPSQTTLVMVGDVTPTAALSLAQRLFGDWKDGDAPAGIPLAVAPPAPRVVVIDMPDAAQAGVVVSRPGIARADPRFYPLSVANTVLGGGFSSRLNQEIRIKRGLAYGASSSVQARRLPGSIAAATQTKNATAAQVVSLIAAEMTRIGSMPIPVAELATRKAVLVGGFGRRIETTSGIADTLGDYILQSVPLAAFARYTADVEAVTPEAAQSAGAALLSPAAASVVVAGDAKAFLPALRAAYPGVEVIPAAALNLDSPGLK